jgi:hypothetical protein
MSFQISMRISVSSSSTTIYNNDDVVQTYSNVANKLQIVNLKYGLTTDNLDFVDDDPLKQYVQLDTPVLTVKNREVFYFSERPTNTENISNWSALRNHLERKTGFYTIFWINNFDGRGVEERVLKLLQGKYGFTKLDGRTTGSWCALVESTTVKREIWSPSTFTIYELIKTNSNYINKETWNNLFSTDFSTGTVKDTYQDAFDEVDRYLWTTDPIRNPLLTISIKLEQHVNNFPTGDEVAWYVQYPEELQSDMVNVSRLVEESARILREVGIETLMEQRNYLVRGASKSRTFLTESNSERIKEYLDLYNTVRSDVYYKIIES